MVSGVRPVIVAEPEDMSVEFSVYVTVLALEFAVVGAQMTASTSIPGVHVTFTEVL